MALKEAKIRKPKVAGRGKAMTSSNLHVLHSMFMELWTPLMVPLTSSSTVWSTWLTLKSATHRPKRAVMMPVINRITEVYDEGPSGTPETPVVPLLDESDTVKPSDRWTTDVVKVCGSKGDPGLQTEATHMIKQTTSNPNPHWPVRSSPTQRTNEGKAKLPINPISAPSPPNNPRIDSDTPWE